MDNKHDSSLDAANSPGTFTEWSDKGVGLIWKVSRLIESVQTPYQLVELFQTENDGKLLVHDGAVMLTERFETQYHDALTHSAMLAHPDPRRVLVIGGGDGGTLREVLRHPEVQLTRQVEIDGEVVRIAREYLPSLAISYQDPRVDLVIGDGLQHLREAGADEYDVVLIDSTDPVGPAAPLCEVPFFEDIRRAIGPRGVMATQIGDPTFHGGHFVTVVKRLRQVFPRVRPYLMPVQMYPSSVWGFGLVSNGADLDRLDPVRAARIEQGSVHWSREFHTGSAALPNWLRKALDE